MANEKERADDPKSLMPMAIYLSFSLIYGRISSGDDYGFMHKIICIDEGWKFLTNPAASQYVQSVRREGRKQGAGLWLISQSYEDFQTDTTKIYWNLAETKIIMKVPPQEARKITAALQLPTSFARSLAEAETGQAVISIDGKVKACMTFNPCPTKLELAIAAGSAGARPITVQDMENPSFI
jgi:type IV secretory pathway VirB4 component